MTHAAPEPDDSRTSPPPETVHIPDDVLTMATRSIEQIEATRWPDPTAGASQLVRRCHELRRMPLGRLGVEDLRVLVAQDVGTETVLPMALGMLRFVPLLEGDYYPGDLLVAVLRRPDTYWATHRIEADLLREALARLDPDDPDYPVDSDLTELAERARSLLS